VKIVKTVVLKGLQQLHFHRNNKIK
jgi:hypothetical protein